MIIQIGLYPPPIGGISIYIKRMKDFLDFKGIENKVWDYSGIKKTEKNVVSINFLLIPLFYALKKNVNLVHYHICGMLPKQYISFFNKIFFKNRIKIITLHGDCTALHKRMIKPFINTINSFDAVICVKHNDKEFLLNHGLSSDV